jgi:hypothetical protein
MKRQKRSIDRIAYFKCAIANKVFLTGVILLTISVLGPFVTIYVFIIKNINFIPFYIFSIIGFAVIATFGLLIFDLTNNCKETYKNYKITYIKLIRKSKVYNSRIDRIARAYCEQVGIDLAIREYKKSHPA